MARITGKNGTVKQGSTVIALISDWSLDMKIPTDDATAMGDQFKQKLSLIREWSGQIAGHYGNASEQTLLVDSSFFAAATDGGPTAGAVTIHLFPDVAATENYTGLAYIDFSVKSAKDKTNSFTAKFQGHSTLTHTP